VVDRIAKKGTGGSITKGTVIGSTASGHTGPLLFSFL